MPQRLIVDMDGVLADVYSQFIRLEEMETGTILNKESLLGVPEYAAFPNGRKHVFSKNFFLDAPVMPGSAEVMQQLNLQYELFIVSAAMEFPSSLPEKHEWLGIHFPFLEWKQIVFCGSKTVVHGHIMIDDHFKNLDHFNGRTLLFTQPHNQGLDEKNHRRVNNWKEIASLLL